MGYEEYLQEYARYRKIKPEELWETLNRIHESARGMKTLEDWLAYMDEYTRKLEEQAKKQDVKREGCVISTLHAVKGLEYDRVYIMNVNEGSMPYRKAVLEAHLEEERRLFLRWNDAGQKKKTLSVLCENAVREGTGSRHGSLRRQDYERDHLLHKDKRRIFWQKHGAYDRGKASGDWAGKRIWPETCL